MKHQTEITPRTFFRPGSSPCPCPLPSLDMFNNTNLCRIPLSFPVFKKFCCRLVLLIAYPWPRDEEQSHPSAMAERYTWAQKHLQTSCLWSPLLFTRTHNPRICRKVVTATLGRCEDKSCFFLCSSLLSRSPKQRWFSLGAAEACSSLPTFAELLATSIQEATWALLHERAYITLHVSSTEFLSWNSNIHQIGWSPNTTVKVFSVCRM